MFALLVQLPFKLFKDTKIGTWAKNAHMNNWQLYLVPHLIWGHWVCKHLITNAIKQIHYSVGCLSPKIGMDIASMYHFFADSIIIWLSFLVILFCSRV